MIFHEKVLWVENEIDERYNERIEQAAIPDMKIKNEAEKRRHMKNIYLIGFMGAGKSTVAEELCKVYKLKKMEMDEQIELEEGMSISDIFAVKGEEYFRQKETELLERCTRYTNFVVSCGGGAAMRECNVAEMKKNGKIVWLNVSSQTVYERVKESHNRPLLEGNMNVSYIESMIEKRKCMYEAAADLVIDVNGKALNTICAEIMDNCR